MSLPPLVGSGGRWGRPDHRQRAVNALFDRSARHYDRACRLMSVGFGQRYRREALRRAGLKPGMRVLDVGIGTGLLAREIVRIVGPTAGTVGIDPSANMLAESDGAPAAARIRGVGERLPFADAVFDFVTMGYALRHVEDLDDAFAEYRRVLARGGRVLLLEITQPRSVLGRAFARAYFGTIVPSMTRVGTGSAEAADLMRFYWETITRCVPPQVIMRALTRAGFGEVERDVDMAVFSAYTATRPR